MILNNKQLIGEGTLMIKDTKGSEILTKEIKISSGINLFNVSNLNLPSGIYYISITSNDLSTEIIKQMIR